MKNFIQKGDILDLNTGAAVNSGDAQQVGQIFGVWVNTTSGNELNQLSTVGVYELPKKSTDDIAVGDALYWDAANDELTKTATGKMLVGAAVKAAGAATTTVTVKLNGISRPDEA